MFLGCLDGPHKSDRIGDMRGGHAVHARAFDPDRSEAEDHLRVIRSLMEKATIYRALSAPAALIGGLLSVGGALLVPWLERRGSAQVSETFSIVWAVIFIITAAASLVLIQRDAARRGEPFLSHGARSAFRAMIPPIGLAACFTLASFIRGDMTACAPWWSASATTPAWSCKQLLDASGCKLADAHLLQLLPAMCRPYFAHYTAHASTPFRKSIRAEARRGGSGSEL